MTQDANQTERPQAVQQMLEMLRKVGSLPFYLPMVSVIPVFAVFNHNASLIEIDELWLPLLAALGLATALLLLGTVVLRNVHRAALVATVFMFWFMTYGHWQQLLETFRIPISAGFQITSNKLLYFVVAAACAAALVLSKRLQANLAGFAKAFNLVAGMLLAYNVIAIASHPSAAAIAPLGAPSLQASQAARQSCGDVYYIILDGYGRHDVLREIYGFDNGGFLKFLQAEGFYVAARSRANYAQTLLSLASSLNLTYLDSVNSSLGTTHEDRATLSHMIRESEVFRLFRANGYQLVTFDAIPWELASVRSRDLHIEPYVWQPTSFEEQMFELTPLSLLLRRSESYLPNWVKGHSIADRHRLNVRHAFNKLRDVPDLPGRKFVFFHILTPHQPFVFDAHGNNAEPGLFTRVWNPVDSAEERVAYIDGYSQQIRFVTDQVTSLIEAILDESQQTPVIVLQGDHGPASGLDPDSLVNTDVRERMAILNALLIPGYGGPELYEKLTPVNTFRLVLNHCLQTDYELLDDQSYFSTWQKPLDLTRVD